MNVYVHKNGKNLGPYTEDELNEELAIGNVLAADRACPEGAMHWSTVGSLLGIPYSFTQAAYQPRLCPQCTGELVLQGDAPDKGTGIIVIVLGILLAPVCVGIILIIWGASLTSNRKYYWHCRGCGRTFPA